MNDPILKYIRCLFMAKIAIIGTGISGLSAAFLLQKKHELDVYEKEARIGGHSRTVTVQHGNRIIPVDTGFIVYNERNYPNLTALFKLLGVSTKDSNMSFAMSVRDGWLEWGARSFNAVFGQRRNIFNWRFLNLFREVMRFNAQVTGAVKREPGITLGEFVERQGFSDWFKKYYLLPMGGAIWSCPPTQMLQFPAQVFVDFFENHGLLAISAVAAGYADRVLFLADGQIVDEMSEPSADRVFDYMKHLGA